MRAGPSQMRGGAMACAWKPACAAASDRQAYLALDFFRSFCIKAKRTKRKIRCACPTSGGNTFEVLVSQPTQGFGLAGFGEPNKLT